MWTDSGLVRSGRDRRPKAGIERVDLDSGLGEDRHCAVEPRHTLCRQGGAELLQIPGYERGCVLQLLIRFLQA